MAEGTTFNCHVTEWKVQLQNGATYQLMQDGDGRLPTC